MLTKIDQFLNNITMYRLMLYVLAMMSAVGIVLGFFGRVSGSGLSLIGSLICLLFVCYVSNTLFARMTGAAVNEESSAITAFILFLILFPAIQLTDYGFIAFAGVAAMASKYVITIYNRHLLNPAAVGAAVAGLTGWGASWWVGSAWMLPVVLIGGLLVVRKTRRGYLFGTFVLAAIASVFVSAWWMGRPLSVDLLQEAFLSWPILFFGTIMLTEPFTLPPSKYWQMSEAALIGLFFAIPFHFGEIFSSPELLLIFGNLFACADGFKRLYRLRLEKKTEIAPQVLEFVFSTETKPMFTPGQYFEWTLPHEKPDTRGNRRTFTVASSPLESTVRLGIRMPTEPSSFKRALSALKIGDVMFASNVGGEFVLPRDPKCKLTFIAGGIGITPFRSMAQHMLDQNQKRDAMLFYACKTPSDFAFQDVFDRASESGLRCLYVATDRDGYLTQEKIKQETPDFLERFYYLSGPPGMVQSYQMLLKKLDVPSSQVYTDYFPGY